MVLNINHPFDNKQICFEISEIFKNLKIPIAVYFCFSNA